MAFAGGQVYGFIHDGTRQIFPAGGAVFSDGNWHHVVCVFDRDADWTAYVDGTLQTNESIAARSGSVDNGSNPLYIGRFQNPSGGLWDGDLDDVSVWTNALTPGEAIALHSVGANSDLGYDASQVRDLFRLHNGETSDVTIGLLAWERVTGLSGSDGELTGSLPVYTLVLDAGAGTGVRSAAAGALPSIVISDVTVMEGDAGPVAALFDVSLSETSSVSVTVQYGTSNGTAVAASDYVATNGTLNFPAGSLTQTVTVSVSGDIYVEGTESYYVQLSNAVSGTILDEQAVGTITDDDTVDGPNDPSLTANLQLWLRADVGVTDDVSQSATDGDNVQSWADQSGNGRDVDVWNSSYPVYRARGLEPGRRPALEFDGSSSLLRNTAELVLSTNDQGSLPQFTIFVVCNPDDTSNRAIFGQFPNSGGGNENSRFIYFANNSGNSLFGLAYDEWGPSGGWLQTGSTVSDIIPANQPYILTLWRDDNDRLLRLITTNDAVVAAASDSSAEDWVATAFGGVPDSFYIGAQRRGKDGATAVQMHFDGLISEVIIYDAALNTLEREAVEDYLSGLYFVPPPVGTFVIIR
jgi:hypothetical protein